MLIVLHSGMSFGVTFAQCAPSSRVSVDQAVIGARPEHALGLAATPPGRRSVS